MTESGLTCGPCDRARELGWWGDSRITHCKGCHRTWSRTSREAHCVFCHRHFGGTSGFDAHLSGPPQRPAGHRDPPGYVQDADDTWRSDYQGPAISHREAVSLESRAEGSLSTGTGGPWL